MFFIGGVGQGSKVINFPNMITCKFCKSRSSCQIVMAYYYFSFFFIPLFKWGKRFFVKMPCCDAVYELAPEAGKAILRGTKTDIAGEELRQIQEGKPQFIRGTYKTGQDGMQAGEDEEALPETRRCPICKYEAPGEFRYCPNCGQRLR